MKSTDRLFYLKPAENFNEALPLGNGRIGAMAYGGVSKEKISLNEDTFWSGFPRFSERDETVPDIYREIRESVLRSEAQRAQRLAEERFGDFLVQMYLPFCNLVLETAGVQAPDNYIRELRMDEGIHRVRFSVGENVYTREAWVSHPAQVFVMHLETTSEAGMSFSVLPENRFPAQFSQKDGILFFSGNAPVCLSEYKTAYRPNDQRYPAEEEKSGMGFCGAVTVLTEDGEVSLEKNAIQVKNARKAVLLFAARTGFNGWDKTFPYQKTDFMDQCLDDLKKAKATPLEELRTESVSRQKSLYEISSFQLDGEDIGPYPTDELLRLHHSGQRKNGVYVLLYNFAKYLLTACSRKDTQPANLQGIWNENRLPKWNCNYTLNINTEMNYWPVLPLGMWECGQPFVRMVKELADAGRKTAKDYYGAPGWVCHHSTDLWRLTHPGTNRIPGNAQWGFWNMASGWLSIMLWEYYLYSADKSFLEQIFPIMEGAAEFYRFLLIEKDGKQILCPSTSPENNYLLNGEAVAVDVSTAMSQEIVKELFRATGKAQSLLAKEDTYTALSERLKEPQVSDDGTLCEWDSPHEEWDKHHRHLSHLFGLFPGDCLNEEQRQAAKCSLLSRGDGSTGWSNAWKINCWARLRDSEHALSLLDRQLAPIDSRCEDADSGGGSYPNLFCAHPPFQIDGNFGACMGILQMLAQVKETGEIDLLPALPAAWKSGSITGIHIPGGRVIDFRWKDGKIIETNLNSISEAERKEMRAWLI